MQEFLEVWELYYPAIVGIVVITLFVGGIVAW